MPGFSITVEGYGVRLSDVADDALLIHLFHDISRLYADLFQSDIIIASPIAIATKLAEDKGTGKAGSAEVIGVYTLYPLP